MITENFNEIPLGLFMVEMNHERSGLCLHIGLKTSDSEWYEQPNCPVFSETATKVTCRDFWEWAKKNLPTYRYDEVVRNALA
jgi:hypothetical protein